MPKAPDFTINPREAFPNHRERGPVRYEYTTEDVAEAMRRNLSTIRSNLGWREAIKGGLRTLSALIVGARMRDQQPLDDDDPRVLAYFKEDAAKWAARWPRFEVYACASCEDALLLVRGLCADCGGLQVQHVDWNAHGYVSIRIGNRLVPYHRIVCSPLAGMHVHHKDHNKWNNHADNLEVLTKEAHQEKHHFGKGTLR